MASDIGQQLLAAMRESDEWAMPADLLRSLEDQGLSVCTAADRKVLEAMNDIPDGTLRYFCELQMIVISTSVTDALKAELARRGGTELPHGIPEGENDKGWPEGTPESVTKGERNV
jgi:hypothetical protein